MKKILIIAAVVLALVWAGFHFFGGKDEVIVTGPSGNTVKPDAVASVIQFSYSAEADWSKIQEATVNVSMPEGSLSWERKGFYPDLTRSTLRTEGDLFVFTLFTQGQVLHGAINKNALKHLSAVTDKGYDNFAAYDVRLFDQAKHQRVTATFQDCHSTVGNLAHSGDRRF